MPYNTTVYSITGTDTYRLASYGLTLNYVTGYTEGTNLQNIEKGARKMYVAAQGKKLLQRDQAGAEALIVAYLCRNGRFRSLFLNKLKSHIFVCLHAFPEQLQNECTKAKLDLRVKDFLDLEVPDLVLHPQWKSLSNLIKDSDNWEPSRRYYYIGKQICHSSNYDVKANAFRMNTLEKSRGKIVLTKQDAEKFLSIYHGLFPEIREWHSETIEMVSATKMLFNLFGYPRYFSGDLTVAHNLKAALAFVPQSTVGSITNIAITETQTYIEDNNLREWDVCQNNHDSLLGQCPDDEDNITRFSAITKQYLNKELRSPGGEIFYMQSEAAAGNNWSPYDAKKNPDGLKPVE